MLLAGAALSAGWPALLTATAADEVEVVPVTAHLSGMLAGYGVLVLVCLMSRWPLLEHSLGSDVLVRWHALGGRIVLTLVLVHAWAAVVSWARMRDESVAAALWSALHLPGLLSATIGTALLVAVGVASARAARRRLRYEVWHGIHLMVYVAVSLSFVHQLAGPDVAGHRVVQLLWALMYTHVFGLVVRHRVVAPLRAATRHRLRVRALVDEAPGVVSLVLEGRHLDELRAESGQFFRWRFLTPDTWLTAHPFSLSAPPTPTRLRLTVKALGDGSSLLHHVEVGTWVVAEGPYGSMTAARRSRRDVLLIAGGVGITPMRALFETMPLERGQDLLLLYRARSPEELVFRAELDALAAHRGARVMYLLGEDRSCLTSAGLQNRVLGLTSRDVYLCGPPPMASAVRSALEQAGLPAAQLHEERFDF